MKNCVISLLRLIRSYLKYLAGKSIFKLPKRKYPTKKYGKGCFWKILDLPLNKDSIIYSFGIGTDITFEQDLVKNKGCKVFAFDPTPKAIKYVSEQKSDNIIVREYAISNQDTLTKFTLPQNDNFVSGSLVYDFGGENIVVRCHKLSTIMKEFNHTHIDLLKMDIEGAEYDVFEDLKNSKILENIEQICIEFHFRFKKTLLKRTLDIFSLLASYGFELIYAADNQEEFTFAKIKRYHLVQRI